MSGDHNLKTTESLVLMFEDCGADVIELGVPFTDPLADGPIIQMAAERALASGTTLTKVIHFVSAIRQKTDIPIVLMTYFNPLYKYGSNRFVTDSVSAGIDGVIIPDLPADEAHDLIKTSKLKNLDTIFMLAPTSTMDRIKLVARESRGFIYYVSMTGITGSKLNIDRTIRQSINNIKAVTKKPICVGFGVSKPTQAKAISSLADGVIVGSAIVKTLHHAPEKLKSFVTSLRKAI